MKKGIALLLLAALLAGCLSACAQKPEARPVTVEGSIFGGKSDDKIAAEVSFDTRWLTKRDNRTYQPELAQFCALLSADSYFREKDYAKQRQNRVLFDGSDEADYDFTAFLRSVGFTQTEHFESYLAQQSPVDSNDSVTLTMGHQVVDGKYDVYALVIRGCFSAQEWCSAFDPGCEDPTYTELTGEHPEWTEPAQFKGIAVAANRALQFAEAFMQQNGDDKLPDRILITGHSRGGGIANLLGADFEKKENVTSYTYTFNTPGVTFDKDAQTYQTIFNVLDSGDFFTDLFPFADGTFTRYGTDLSASVPESETLRNAIASLKGRDDYACVTAEAAAQYRTLFAQRFPSRELLCEPETVCRSFETKADAEAALAECRTLIGSEAGLKLEDLCSLSEIRQEPDGRYAFDLTYCGAALLRTFAMVLAYGESACTAACSLFAEDALGCEIAAFLMENAAGINGGHLLANTYVIAGTLKAAR